MRKVFVGIIGLGIIGLFASVSQADNDTVSQQSFSPTVDQGGRKPFRQFGPDSYKGVCTKTIHLYLTNDIPHFFLQPKE